MYLKIYIVQYDFAILLGLRIKIIYKEFVKRATHRRNSVLVNPVNFVPLETAGLLDAMLDPDVSFLHTLKFFTSVAMIVPVQSVVPYFVLVAAADVQVTASLFVAPEPLIMHAPFALANITEVWLTSPPQVSLPEYVFEIMFSPPVLWLFHTESDIVLCSIE